MRTKTLTLIVLLFCWFQSLHAQLAGEKTVAQIFVLDAVNGTNVQGGGLMVGHSKKGLLLLTANGLVAQGADVIVQPYGSTQKQFAEILHREPVLGVALLVVQLPQIPDLPAVRPGEAPYRKGEPVVALGYRNGRQWIDYVEAKVELERLYLDDRLYTVTAEPSIDELRGWPLFRPDGAWMGLTTGNGFAAKANAIQEWLDQLKVTTEKTNGGSLLKGAPVVDMVAVKERLPRNRQLPFNYNKNENLYQYDFFDIRDFELGKAEVTVEQFSTFVEETKYKTDAETIGYAMILAGKKGKERLDMRLTKGIHWRHDAFGRTRDTSEGHYPVVHVSWNDATAYCEWLSKKTGETYRLPTRTEWMYAFLPNQTPQKITFYLENIAGREMCDSIKVYQVQPEYCVSKLFHSDRFPRLAPVGTFQPNEWGLQDMYGNVSELTSEARGNSNEYWTMGPNWLSWYAEKDGGFSMQNATLLVRYPGQGDRIPRAGQYPVMRPRSSNCYTGFRVLKEVQR